jgi:hypothetical protein
LTHHRTHAVQLGGSEGLAPWQLNTFTKHMLDKLNSAYQPEMNQETAKVMASFEKDEPYFHGSSNLQHPVPVPTLIDFLLPNYRRWKREANSLEGNKSSCCRKFLDEVIPYLVEVLVQDGIFLIRDFPNHPMSNYIKVRTLSNYSCTAHYSKLTLKLLFAQNKVTGYERWAQGARRQVDALLASRRVDELRALNGGT